MGLDMYLNVRRYVSQWDWSRSADGISDRVLRQEFDKLVKTAGLKKYTSLTRDSAVGAEVEATVMYWRKANAIHQWFIDNCADGIDDCRPVYVSRSRLEELLDTVREVLAHRDRASELLPTQSGFFFGSTDYEDWYFEDLERTEKELSKVLEVSKEDDVSFTYQASW